MKNIKKNTILILGPLLSLLFMGSISAQTYPEPGNIAKGAQTWSENCSRCHNMRDPKDLRDDQWITSVFHMRVRAGLTGQQTRDILTFLQQSNNETVVASNDGKATKPSTSMSSSGLTGAQIYAQTCIACHGNDGMGTVPGSPKFAGKNSPLNKSDVELMKNISEGFQSSGSPMAMPAKGGNANLTVEDIRNVLKYIRDKFSK
jgi:mono/diheme cytochrome c family protein